MNCHYVVLQATYHVIEYALYSSTELIEKHTLEKTEACRFLVTRLNSMLAKNKLSWAEIEFIGVNQGPAPFTTLRTLITTINGISFAQHIPLIGVDGLKSFLTEQPQNGINIVLQNAFAKDVYFGIQDGSDVETGWDNGSQFLAMIAEKYPHQTVRFVGNAVFLHQQEIESLFGTRGIIHSHEQEMVSLKTVAFLCKELWNTKKKGAPHLSPLYLKTQEYKQSH